MNGSDIRVARQFELAIGELKRYDENMGDPTSLSVKPVDHVASTVKGLLGAIPIAGPLLAEVAGTLIPNQRVERLTEFAELLSRRLKNLEESLLEECLRDEDFTETLEESLRQVSRSTSTSRREHIANLIAGGIRSEDMDFIEARHLLRLLGEINDPELIWLRYYSDHQRRPHSEYWKKHEEVLAPVIANMGSDRAELDRATLQQSYKDHLERLGLLRTQIKFDRKTKMPEFDPKQGIKRGSFEITPLGRLLVRFIEDWIDNDNHNKQIK